MGNMEDNQKAQSGPLQEMAEDSEEEYQFIKEVIKERPISRERLRLYAGLVGAGAVLFGVIAAIVFALLNPYVQNLFDKPEEPPKVEITQDEDMESAQEPAGEPTQPEDVPQIEEAETQDNQLEEDWITLDEYEKLYADMLEVVKEPKRSLVTIIGINSAVDWFNEAYDNPVGQMSGLILADNGVDLFILTEYRIVENVERIQVTFCDGAATDARFQKMDPNTGLTILKVPMAELDPGTRDAIAVAPLGSSFTVSQGQPIIAIGSPMGYSDSVAYGVVTSVTNRISAIDNQYNLVTTDIMGSAEGSGVLLNLDGEVIGIIAQSYSNEGSKNMVTALAISQIKELLEDLTNNEELIYVGVKGQDVTPAISKNTGIPQGIYVENIVSESPAMEAGIQAGDVIVGVGAQSVRSIKAYHDAISAFHADNVIKITVMRMGTEGYVEKEFRVKLSAF